VDKSHENRPIGAGKTRANELGCHDAQSPRLEYPGALYHVTARGVQRSTIYLDDADRVAFVDLVARTLGEGDARALAYCLMGNLYHLVLQTARANLSTLMRRINSSYGQVFNRRHGRSGHVFEGRFHLRPCGSRRLSARSVSIRQSQPGEGGAL